RLVEVGADSEFILHPGEFVLASTYEVVTLPEDIASRLEGKSSLGRLGLLTHSTAGFIDPGFSGHVTLELSNVATLPMKLYPGMKIGQLCMFRLTSPAEHPYGSDRYGSRYQGQRGPTPSRAYLNFSRAEIGARGGRGRRTWRGAAGGRPSRCSPLFSSGSRGRGRRSRPGPGAGGGCGWAGTRRRAGRRGSRTGGPARTHRPTAAGRPRSACRRR